MTQNSDSRRRSDPMTEADLRDWFDSREATRRKYGCVVALVLLLAALGIAMDLQDKTQGVI